MAARSILNLNNQCLLLTFTKRAYSSKADKNVAFLGLGNMGGFMAANLVKKGFAVRGYDPSKEALAVAAKNGITGADSIAAAVDGADVVVSILPSNKVVLDAYLGKDGVIAHALEDAAKNGITGADSIAAAFDGADVVVSVLPSNKFVLDAYLGKDGVIAHVSSFINDGADKNALKFAAKNGTTGADTIAVAVDSADVCLCCKKIKANIRNCITSANTAAVNSANA
ncbi:NAD binding domain of 6-phosphogluconate dehydrogenase domain-containing protein [Phthorimaea operculella]|nr:NAD binding domain of 6-phosphogluconate dehydrogenase domain-containing protein [Phthorimaea operculella]